MLRQGQATMIERPTALKWKYSITLLVFLAVYTIPEYVMLTQLPPGPASALFTAGGFIKTIAAITLYRAYRREVRPWK